MVITDAAVHIWQAPTAERPWDMAKAHLPQPIGCEDLRVRMKEAGVDRVVLVPPSFAGGYSDYSIEAATKYPGQFAVMAAFKLNKPDSRQTLEYLMSQPHVLGVRVTFHHDHDEGFMTDGTADWFWPAAAKKNMAVMINGPKFHKQVGAIAERYPNLRLIYDHMGRNWKLMDEKLGDALAPTIALAKYPNIFVKLTSAQAASSEGYPYRNIHPYLKQLIEAFGPRRCFWGTDLSSMLRRKKGTYREAVTMFTEEMNFLSKENLEWIMGRALSECLNWPVAPGLASRKTS